MTRSAVVVVGELLHRFWVGSWKGRGGGEHDDAAAVVAASGLITAAARPHRQMAGGVNATAAIAVSLALGEPDANAGATGAVPGAVATGSATDADIAVGFFESVWHGCLLFNLPRTGRRRQLEVQWCRWLHVHSHSSASFGVGREKKRSRKRGL